MGKRNDDVRVSKAVAAILRHAKGGNVPLDPQGWASVEALLAGLVEGGIHCGRDRLGELVARDAKGRFEFSADGSRIRATQGHSVAVDLELAPVVPPAVLFHGTGAAALASIRADGLLPGGRQFVHLSGDEAAARVVAARRERPVVLEIRALDWHAAGGEFRLSANGVWLAREVPAAHIRFPEGTE